MQPTGCGTNAPVKIKKILRRTEISTFLPAVIRVAVTVSRVSVVERIVSREYVQTTCPGDRDLATLGTGQRIRDFCCRRPRREPVAACSLCVRGCIMGRGRCPHRLPVAGLWSPIGRRNTRCSMIEQPDFPVPGEANMDDASEPHYCVLSTDLKSPSG